MAESAAAVKRGEEAEKKAAIFKTECETLRNSILSPKGELDTRNKELAQATTDIRTLKAELAELQTKHGKLPGSLPTHSQNRQPGSSTRVRKSQR